MTPLRLISLTTSLLPVLIKTVKLKSALAPWRWSFEELQKIFQNRVNKKCQIVHQKQTNLKKVPLNNFRKTYVHIQHWLSLLSHHYLPYCPDYVIRLIFIFNFIMVSINKRIVSS